MKLHHHSHRWTSLITSAFLALVVFSILYGWMSLFAGAHVQTALAQSGGDLIKNGDFFYGSTEWWTGDFQIEHIGDNYFADLRDGNRLFQEVVPSETGVYQLAYDCKTYQQDKRFTFGIESPDPRVAGRNVWQDTNGYADCVTTDWQTITRTYVLEASKPYTVTFWRNTPEEDRVYIDNVSLTLLHSYDKIDVDTGLIENGEFIGPDGWVYTGTLHFLHVGQFSTTVGLSQIAHENRLAQQVTPSETGVYQLAFDCKTTATNEERGVFYGLDSPDPRIIDPNLLKDPEKAASCEFNWQTITQTYVLEAGKPYTVIFWRSNTATKLVYIDNVSLTLLHSYDEIDVDTGLIENGEFIGPDGWVYAGALHNLAVGAKTETVGVTQLGRNNRLEQVNILPQNTMTYSLSFDCATVDLLTHSIDYKLTGSDGSSYPPSGYQDENCSSWDSYSIPVFLQASTTYTLTFRRQSSAVGTVLLDNISLKYLTELPDASVWNSGAQCPFSTSQSSRDFPEGVDTLNGNFNYGTTDLYVPAAGGALSFARSYASGGIAQYESVGRLRSAIPGGWVHNYEMQIRTQNTQIPNTVELQTPGGTLLSFYIQENNGVTTFTPYAGVTADLTLDPSSGEYLLTGFDQSTYSFDSDGRLLEQLDSFGNSIDFSYDGSGRLYRATQGSHYLEYAYDAQDRLTSVTDHSGRTISLDYDAQDHLYVVTDTLELPTHYTYDGSTQRLTQITDPTDRVVKDITYDTQGRATQVRDSHDNLLLDVDFALSATGGITENVVLHRGIPMTHYFDERRTLVRVGYDCEGAPGCGSSFDMQYDGNFKLAQVTDALGQPVQMTWNDSGCNLEQVSDVLEHDTIMWYDGLNNLIQVTNARDHDTTFGYDSTSYPTFRTSMTDALLHTTNYQPTIAGVDGVVGGLLKSQTDPNQNTTAYTYNDYGQLIETVQAQGTTDAMTTRYGYDSVGRLITTTQVGNTADLTTLYVYDDGSRLLAEIANWQGNDPAGWAADCTIPALSSDSNICTRYDYDDAGRLITTTNALGQINLSLYDDLGRVVTQVTNYDGVTSVATLCTDFSSPDPETNICGLTHYDDDGRVESTVDSLGHVTHTFYDALGRVSGTVANQVNVTSLSACSFSHVLTDQDLCTLYEYDAVGNTILVTDPLGRQTRTFYDALRRPVGTIDNWSGSITQVEDLPQCLDLPAQRDTDICTLYEYDEVGNTTIVTNTLGIMTRTFYDPLNRVEASVQNWQPSLTDPSQCILSPLNESEENICTLYGYDDGGRQITTTNALNQTNLTVYDHANRPVVQVTNWDGVATISPSGSGCASDPTTTQNICVETTYDTLGRTSLVLDLLDRATLYTYDGLGRVLTTSYSIDPNGPLAPPPHIVWTTTTGYDALGNRLSYTDAEGHTTTYSYDSLNRMWRSESEESVVNTQEYNAAGWLLTSSNGLNQTTTFTYDDRGRQETVTDPVGNVTTYEYDALGNQTAQIDAEDVRTTYAYDDLNRLTEVIENDVPGNVPTAESDVLTQYAYDALGNRLVVTNSLNYRSTLTTYDDLNRPIVVEDALGNETRTAYNALSLRTVLTDGNNEVTTFTYDDLNRLITTTYLADGETVQYDYDAMGHRLAMTDSLGTTSYTYDDMDRLLTVTDPSAGTLTYTYDLVGNRTGITYPDEREVTYSYDGDNRLTRVVDWNQDVTAYKYDDAGRLAGTTLPNSVQTEQTYNDAGQLVRLTHTLKSHVV